MTLRNSLDTSITIKFRYRHKIIVNIDSFLRAMKPYPGAKHNRSSLIKEIFWNSVEMTNSGDIHGEGAKTLDGLL